MSEVREFWAVVIDVWQAGIYGVDLGQILVSIAVFLLFLGLRRLFSASVIGLLHQWTRRTRYTFDDQLLDALREPLRFVFVVVGFYVAVRIAPFPEDVDAVLNRITRTLILFTIFWVLYRAIEPLSFLFDRVVGIFGQAGLSLSIRNFFAKVAKFAIVAVGFAAILQEWDFNVGAVLGGLGLIGMAVAFGAQNLISNLFAGLAIFIEHIFEVGDWIKSPDVEGTVETIGFRTTKVRRFDKSLVTIPNQKLSDEAVINFSRMTHRRIYWLIGVEYRTTEDQLRQIVEGIRDYVTTHADFETDQGKVVTMVHVDSFNSSSIDIMLYCFTRTTAWTEWMAAKERLAFTIKQLVEGAGTGFAFPSRSLYVETVPFGKPEAFPAGEAADENGGGEASESPKRIARDSSQHGVPPRAGGPRPGAVREGEETDSGGGEGDGVR